ncbi:hypothetical protein [Natrinema versiforme]|uniref:DUF7310 domain-containing protein n=1 Tax=Natrinema versiforme TaxID=88724 RepID=A0A4V1FZB1_9EURY|nr:hypothetical protein [Natrinema versiforme]QCS41612.1 hypothetical protein FEJ81_04310 [Natrinema versiforme]
MSDIERIERRLSAVERAVVDGDIELDELADIASVASALEDLTARVEEHERRIATLEGRIDALDGVVGNVESVNGAVERRADAAVAAVDRLEYRLGDIERAVDDATDLNIDDPRPVTADATSDDRTGATETNRLSSARGDRDSSTVSSEPDDAGESGSDPPAIERTVSEIVSPTTDGDASTTREPRTTAGATQAALDSRLSESAGRDGAADDDCVDGASRPDETHDSPSDSDEGSTGGVLQSLRARLP